jgi:hypothetical protein
MGTDARLVPDTGTPEPHGVGYACSPVIAALGGWGWPFVSPGPATDILDDQPSKLGHPLAILEPRQQVAGLAR